MTDEHASLGPSHLPKPSADLLASWAAHEQVDRTVFQRCMRLLQSVWRHRKGLLHGEHRGRPAGARLPVPEAEEHGWNFLTPAVLEQVHRRLSRPQPHEMIQRSRLWANLLSSQPMCFNLFGELAADLSLATSVARKLWTDTVEAVTGIEFEWSPGRTDPQYLGDRTAFDVVVFHTTPDGGEGFIGIETKYHEDALSGGAGGRGNPRYAEVADRSDAFAERWEERILDTQLEQVWRDHLLALAMLQSDSSRWATGRFVLVFPEENTEFAGLSTAYAEVLTDSTFEPITVQQLVDATRPEAPEWAGEFHARYLDFGVLDDLPTGPFET